jgi:prephenate dehydratase
MTNSGRLSNIANKRPLQACAAETGDCRCQLKQPLLDVFNAVSSNTPLALIPQENSTYGAVVETDDLLRLPTTGREIFVVGETTISIQHCLLVRRGVKLQHIETVLSHEQAS